jgi:hypothetical protein
MTAAPLLPRLFLGLDLGQRADHSALALLERAEIPTGEFDHVHWRPLTSLTLTLRLIRLWPLNTPYLEIASQTISLLRQLRPLSPQSLAPVLALDASGPGAPILEILRGARSGAQLQPCLITAGHHESLAKDSTLNIPRPLLLSHLRVLLERGRLVIPATLPHAPRLRDELAALSPSKTGPHDDLAIALALASHAALHFTPSLRKSL